MIHVLNPWNLSTLNFLETRRFLIPTGEKGALLICDTARVDLDMSKDYIIEWIEPTPLREPRTVYDLEERLEDFGVAVIDMTDGMVQSKGATHLGGQVIRSSSSPALNYGEAQSAESRRDFIHKMKVILKELRETRICLRMIRKAKSIESPKNLDNLINESQQLISIWVKSIQTAEKNAK